MSRNKKSDNSYPEAKLKLRRTVLNAAGLDQPFRVFDACAGSGMMWKTLAREYECRVWSNDLKNKPGRLRMDSARLLRTGVVADVYDIDTYGMPWTIFDAALEHSPHHTVMFLTLGGAIGKKQAPGFNLSHSMREVLNIPLSMYIPPGLGMEVARLGIEHHLAQPRRHGYQGRIWEADIPGANARYIGLYLTR